MITWEDFIAGNKNENSLEGYEKTDIACPKCGAAVWKNVEIVLASYPAKYSYICMKCGWSGIN